MLSHADDDASWQGERGFVHERVDAKLKELASTVRATSTPAGRRR